MMKADTNIKGNTTKERKEVKPAKQPGSSKKRIARGGGGQTTCLGEAGNTNKQLPQLMDSCGNGNTDDALSQSNVPNSPEMDTNGAMIESSEKDMETVCSHFKTVWGLRLDLLLLAIVVVIAAVILKLPLGEQQVVIGNPAIQQQLKDLTKQFKNIENKFEDLKSEVNIKSIQHRVQASKIEYDNRKINDNLNHFDPDEMLNPDIKTTVGKIQESIAKSHTDIAAVVIDHTTLKDSMNDIKRDLLASITEQEKINSNFTKDISNIREDVNASIDASSNFSVRIDDVKLDTNKLKSDLNNINSEVDGMKKGLEEADTKVSEVKRSAATAQQLVDEANEKLNIVEQHLLNKNALTGTILILFFLIIGLMVYVLKLKSPLEPALADGLEGRREMDVILRRMPSNPRLGNAVCIVSFDSNSSDEYTRIIKETVGPLHGVSFRTHFIRKHADIAELPHCKLYIMCVEFTERHVIIEEQGLGLGDLKLTTYRGVRKLGGDLVIMYIHDPGSRKLTDDKLYSDGVYCVKKQQELKELCELDRFISAHKKLNTAQKNALETAISNVLNIQAARY